MESLLTKELIDLLKDAGPWGFAVLTTVAILLHLKVERQKGPEVPPFVSDLMRKFDTLSHHVREEARKTKYDADKREDLQHKMGQTLHEIKAIIDLIARKPQ